MAKKTLITIIAGMAAVTALCHAATLLVPGQYPTIQAGIDASRNGDTVLVSPGTYVENIDFLGKSITVKSAQGAETTTIDGNDIETVVTFENDEDEDSILEGFTVTNGLGGGGFSNYRGGGINCRDSSSPTIKNNIITGNTSPTGGGGIACNDYSDPIIINNTITNNSADYGAGIYGDHCFLTVLNNTIAGNDAGAYGGGVYGYYVGATVRDNVIKGNTAFNKGGGMAILEATHTSYPIWQITNNVIADNWARTAGGGMDIQCDFPAPGHNIMNNTITGNRAGLGGAMALYLSAYPVITNSILWNNSAPEIYVSTGGGNATVNYSDVAGGWPGTGNLDDDPSFVYPDQNDYRLQWGSPCIDTGDPASPWDPDGTICDMGCFYYDQSKPVRILLTPHDTPIQIPAGGGSFDYTIWAANLDSVSRVVNIWCDVTLPDGSIYGPLLGPVSVTLNSGMTLSRERTQNVPAGAPAGGYGYQAYGVAGADTSTDSFAFGKLGSSGSDELSGWFNTGQSFDEWLTTGDETAIPEEYSLKQNYPNPFNPTTAIGYQLSANNFVSLRIYDTAGRFVTTLVDGWREAGAHEVTFDGSGLAAGIYFARLQAGEYVGVEKLILLK